MNLLSPPDPFIILAVEVFVNQRFTAHYTEEDRTARPRPRLYRLARVRRDCSASRARLPDSPSPSPVPSPSPAAPAALHGSPIPVPHPGEPRRKARRPSFAPHGSTPGPSQAGLPSALVPEPAGFELDRPDSRGESQEQTWSRGGREAAVRLKAEEEWAYEAMFRLPTDETIRPSTLKGAHTPLVVSHEVRGSSGMMNGHEMRFETDVVWVVAQLVLGIAYRHATARPDSEPEKLYLSRKVDIAAVSSFSTEKHPNPKTPT